MLTTSTCYGYFHTFISLLSSFEESDLEEFDWSEVLSVHTSKKY